MKKGTMTKIQRKISEQSKTKKREKKENLKYISQGIKSIKSISTNQIYSIPAAIIGKR